MNNRYIIYALFLLYNLVGYQEIAGQSTTNNYSQMQQNWHLFQDQGEYDKAIEQAKMSYQLGKSTQNNELMALALNWEAQSLLAMPRRVSVNRNNAKKLLKESLSLIAAANDKDLQLNNLKLLREVAEKEEDTKSYAVYNKQISDIEKLVSTNKSNQALTEKVDLLDNEKEYLSNRVASLSAAQMKAELMLAMQKNYLDSLQMTRMQDSFQLATKELALKEQASQLALQDNYIRLQSSQRNFFIALAIILLLLVLGVYLRFTAVKKYNTVLNAKNEALVAEQQRSEMLLLNILPDIIAKELKAEGITKARRYEQATVMFTDFKDFSSIAMMLSPEHLVAELDIYFKAFDEIIAKYNIEKIKTIGDAYMCAGGLPDVKGSEPKDVVLAALEIQALLDQFKQEREQKGKPFFEARIGIHTGPLVAGVVGSIKFAYDIWGDTVNIASRLESNGQAGRVNISATTYALVKDYFKFEARGIIPIKNNHEIAMYFVS